MVYSGNQDSAIYKSFGENPIGVDSKLMALHVDPSSSMLGSLLLMEFDY